MAWIRFTQSARRHRVSAGRAREVLADPYVLVPMPSGAERDPMWIHLGDDASGRALEVGVFYSDQQLLVAHVMDLRAKFRPLYEQAKAVHARERGTP